MTKNITLKNVLNTSRTDFKVISGNDSNTVIFLYNQLVYMYSYCTCFFYEVTKVEFDCYPFYGYKIKTVIKQEIPKKFNTFFYFKDKKQNYHKKISYRY